VLDHIQICTGYRSALAALDYFRADMDTWPKSSAIYGPPRWRNISGCRRWDAAEEAQT
jgi:adenylosuccinate synthase